jgi:AcrR family transcriptional regulator
VARTRKRLDFRAVAAALTEAGEGPPGMDEIARRLGVAKPTLYRMAGTRDELIAISIDAEAERLLDALHHHGLDGFFVFAEADPAGFALLFGGRYAQAHAAVKRVERRIDERVPGAGHAFIALAAAVVLQNPARSAERLRSDFDAAANLLSEISDPVSVGAASDAA